jgi:hypothetical protein
VADVEPYAITYVRITRYDEPGVHSYTEPAVTNYTEPGVTIAQEGRTVASVHVVYRSIDEDPGIAYEWRDRDGSLLDLSTATFSMAISPLEGGTVTDKTSGIVGAATSPNLVITWAEGELATLGVGTYTFLVTATVATRERTLNPGRAGRITVRA